jgi:hypothetical protein
MQHGVHHCVYYRPGRAGQVGRARSFLPHMKGVTKPFRAGKMGVPLSGNSFNQSLFHHANKPLCDTRQVFRGYLAGIL